MRSLLIFIAIVILPHLLSAQYYWDVGIKLGATGYLGEFGGKEKERRDWLMDIKLNQTRWLAGAFARYKINRNIGLNLGFTYARIQGADYLSTNPQRVTRNLSFRNDFFELSLRGEYYFYAVNDVGGKGRYQLDFRSYIFAGVAGFYHNPKAQLGGAWYALQPLTTEGPDNKYSKFQFSIPAGVGFYYTYKRRHRFGWEFSWMTTFTDYMDDASGVYTDPSNLPSELSRELANRTPELSDPPENPDYYGNEGNIRGDPKHDDAYLFTALSYSKVIRGKGNIYRSKYNYVYGNKRRKRRTRAKF